VITVTNQLLRDFCRAKGWGVPAPATLHLAGIRGAVPRGPAQVSIVPNVPDAYNDTLLTFGTHLSLFLGSTDPGGIYTAHPTNSQGAAHLTDGLHRFLLGTHKGHRALVQAEAFSVRRDRDRDGTAEPGEPLTTGQFGIHIHAGGSRPRVGAWSAGCQVIQGGFSGVPWQRFLAICEASKQNVFHYYLMSGKDLGEFVA
jgi:hypothetical protein